MEMTREQFKDLMGLEDENPGKHKSGASGHDRRGSPGRVLRNPDSEGRRRIL